MDVWKIGLGFAAALLAAACWDWFRSRSRHMSAAGSGATGSGASSEADAALRGTRSSFIAIALFSGVINLMMLTGSLFMLEVYDRVLPSRSLPTLVALGLLVAGLYAAQGIIDVIRTRMLTRIGGSLDERLSKRVFVAVVTLPLKTVNRGDGLSGVRDLDTVRQFLSGLGPTALFDLPWMPLYLGLIYAFHPLLGMTALVGALLLVLLTVATEVLTRAPVQDAGIGAMARNRLAEASVRNAEVLTAMGLADRIGERWRELGQGFIDSQQRAADIGAALGSLSKVLRMMLQSGMLALGAYLVIRGEATGGVIIASSILMSRALAPVELAIAHWKGFLAARQSWQRLKRLLSFVPAFAEPLALPAPCQRLSVEGVSVAPPGGTGFIVKDVSFTLEAGEGLGIIGPSASGKSSLVRALVGVWTPVHGKIRLDGAALDQWSASSLGVHVGYLPQDIELFAGTVAQNIARFEPEADADAVIRAAQAAGVHDMIVGLKNGYETDIGEQGAVLSAGQRQRLALARALYREPFLVVLDEPNSNLDAEGEAALMRALHGIRRRGGIAVVVAHRPSALNAVDKVLAMTHGKAQGFGPKDEVLGKVLGSGVPLKVVPEVGRSS